MAIAPRKFRTERARKRYHRSLLIEVAILAVGFVTIVGALAVVTRVSWLRVSDVSIEGVQLSDPKQITDAAENAIAGNYVHLVPRAFIGAISKERIAANVLSAVPRVATAEVSRSGLSSITVSVTERVGVAWWCGDVVPDIATLRSAQSRGAIPGESCYLIDETGFIFAPANEGTLTTYPRFWAAIDKSRPIGARMVSLEGFAHLREFVTHLNESAIESLGILLVDENEGELYLADGTKVLFLHSGDLAKTARSIEAAINSGLIPLGEDKVEYVDMRFPDRAYFKPTESVPSEASSAETAEVTEE